MENKTIAEKLIEEINRVREIQGEFNLLRGVALVEPQIMMMEQSIQQALKAQSEGDPIKIIGCLKDLSGYNC